MDSGRGIAVRAPSGPAGADTIRVSVHGPAGIADVVVPAHATPGSVVTPDLAAAVGGPDVRRLARAGGDVLDPGVTLVGQGVADGDVLLVLTPRSHWVGRSRPTSPVASTRPYDGAAASLAAAGAAVMTVAALVADFTTGSVRLGMVCGLVLIAVAGAALGLLIRSRAHRGVLVWQLTAPVAAAGAGWVLADVDRADEASLLLGVVQAAVLATAAAAAGRAARRNSGELAVWAGGAATAGLLAIIALVTGGGTSLVTAALLVAAIWTLRLLPPNAIRVPDDELLELDRMMTSAWSARDAEATQDRAAGPRQGRLRVRAAAADRVVADGGALLRAGVVAASVAGAATALFIMLPLAWPGTTLVSPWVRVGSAVLLWTAGLAVALRGRAQRDPVGRVALLAGGGLTVTAAVVLTLPLLPWGFAGLVGALVAGGVVAVAVAVGVGRGWRSLVAARVADVVDALATSLVLPAAMLAAGGVEWIRALVW